MSKLRVDAIEGRSDPGKTQLPWKTEAGLSWLVDTTGVGGNYEIAMPQTVTSYEDGMRVRFKTTTNNTGPCQVNVDSLGFVPLVKPDGVAFESGDLPAGAYVDATFDLVLGKFLVSSVVGDGVTVIGGSSNEGPVANFSYSANNKDYTFTNASFDADGVITSYAWDFGDGNTSTQQNPSHTYAADGSYSVTLTVEDDKGASNSITKPITVTTTLSPPSANFNLTTDGYDVSTFDTSSQGDGTITSWLWDFGDGTTATTQNATHTYLSTGTYTISLTVTDSNGLSSSKPTNVVVPVGTPPNANFTAASNNLQFTFTDSSTDNDGTVTGWSWDFGDGNTSTQTNPSHTYSTAGSYNVTLTVTDNSGLTDSTTKQVTASSNAGPNSSFTSAQQVQENSIRVNFTSTSSDPDGSIVSYLWDFGDGNTSTQQNPSHDYTSSGTYTVRLTVTDDDGATDFSEASEVINVPAPLSATYSTNEYLTTTSGYDQGALQDSLLVTPSGGSGSYRVTWTKLAGDEDLLFAAPVTNTSTPVASVTDDTSQYNKGTFAIITPTTPDRTTTMTVGVQVEDLVTGATYAGPNITCHLTVNAPSGGGGGGGGGAPGCFAYGTKILMADGTERNIEHLEIGDKVAAYDLDGLGARDEWKDYSHTEFKGSLSEASVTAAKRYIKETHFWINRSIRVTYEHPILIKRQGSVFWSQARHLKVGDLMLGSDESEVPVTSVEYIQQRISVVRLDVEELDNYFANGILAHNKESQKLF